MSDVIVYGFPLSTFVRTVRMALEEKRVAYELDPVTPHSPEIEGKHPFGKVPAFRHGDVALFETAAITTYIDDAFDGPDLQPKDRAGRARMHQWISAYNDSFYPRAVTIVIQRLVEPMRGNEPDEAAVADILPAVRKACQVFDAALAGRDWLVGDGMTIADMFVAPMVFYLRMAPEGKGLLAGLGDLNRWYKAIRARASFAATAPELPAAA